MITYIDLILCSGSVSKTWEGAFGISGERTLTGVLPHTFVLVTYRLFRWLCTSLSYASAERFGSSPNECSCLFSAEELSFGRPVTLRSVILSRRDDSPSIANLESMFVIVALTPSISAVWLERKQSYLSLSGLCRYSLDSQPPIISWLM